MICYLPNRLHTFSDYIYYPPPSPPDKCLPSFKIYTFFIVSFKHSDSCVKKFTQIWVNKNQVGKSIFLNVQVKNEVFMYFMSKCECGKPFPQKDADNNRDSSNKHLSPTTLYRRMPKQ